MPDDVQWASIRPNSNLPVEILAIIGQMIVMHSHLEEALQHIIYALAGVDSATGRTAIRAPRLSDRWTMIEDLAEQRGCTIDALTVENFRHDLGRMSDFRDYLAHGVFYRDASGNVYCRKVRGKWVPPSSNKPVKHAKVPAAYAVTVEETARVCAITEVAYEAARDLHRDIVEQLRAQLV